MPDLGAVQFLVAPGLGAFHAHVSLEDSWQGEIVGTVRRLPSGRWQARYSAPDGTRVTAERTFATRAEAASHLAGVQADLDRGTYVDPVAGAETFGEYATTWLAQRADLRPRTAELYEGLLARLLLPHLATVPLARLTPSWPSLASSAADPTTDLANRMTLLALEVGDNPRCHRVALAQATGTRTRTAPEPIVSRRGEDARARARRQRASVAIRSQTARLAVGEPETSTGDWRPEVQPSRLPAPDQPQVVQPVPARVAPIPKRKPRRRPADLDVTRLENLVTARQTAAVAVDAEVRRLRRLGGSWPQLADPLGVTRQAARQRYGP